MRNSLLFIFAAFLVETAISKEKEIDFKAVKFYQVSIETAVYGIYRDGGTVWTFPGSETFVVKSSFKPEAKEQDLAFGSLHNPYDGSERFGFEGDRRKRIRGMIRKGSKLAFLDSALLQFQVYDEDKKVWLQPTDIILDTARPPRDKGGEAPRAESIALRAKLSRELSLERGNPDLIAGIADMPKSWRDRDGSQYVLFLRGTSYPLLTLKCDEKEFKHCMVQRACFLSGLSRKDYQKVTSIAREPRDDSILLLMPEDRKILSLRGSSCNRIKFENRFQLPKSLAAAQGLFVDKEGNYWMSLREPDGATSASLFIWDARSF